MTIYTDGSASPNPGQGGYAAILVEGQTERLLSGGYVRTTNNRMELLAVIAGLEALVHEQPTAVTVVSDSAYVVKGSGWVAGWARKNWKRQQGPVQNIDLWQRYLAASERHQVTFEWVKGHNGHAFNERCDELASAAARGPLLIDHGYLA